MSPQKTPYSKYLTAQRCNPDKSIYIHPVSGIFQQPEVPAFPGKVDVTKSQGVLISALFSLRMIIISMILMDGGDKRSTIDNWDSLMQGFPYEPPVPIASADDQSRHILVQAFPESKIIDEES